MMKYVRLHDLIRDMALRITASSPRFMVKAGERIKTVPYEHWSENLERISFMDSLISELPITPPICPRLTTLLLNDRYRSVLEVIPDSFFTNMPCLEVLDLSRSRITSLPESISNLENLHALILRSCSQLKYVPSLEKLKALKMFVLTCSKIEELPEGIEELVNLRKLDLSGNTILRMSFPSWKLLRLSKLQYLRIDDTRVEVSAEDLLCLSQLKVVSVHFHNVQEFIRYAISQQFQGLQKYCLIVGKYALCEKDLGREVWISSESVPFGSGVDQLVLPAGIELFGLEGFHDPISLSAIPWFKDAKDLRRCVVECCNGLESIFSSSSFLEDGQISLGTIESFDLIGLPRLRVLLDWIAPPHNIYFNLKELCFSECDAVKNIFHVQLLQNFPNLERLSVMFCENMEDIIVEKAEMRDQGNHQDYSNSIGLPKLKTLSLIGLPRLKSIYNGLMVCPSLEEVEVHNCPMVRRLPLSFHMDGEQATTPPALKVLKVYKEWWESLELDDPVNKSILRPYVAPYDEKDVSNPSSSGGGILSDEEDVSSWHSSGGDGGGGGGSSRKQLQTRFSQEQEDKMVEFAERVGWRIQKQDEAAVERFCGEIGVTRQVLKVWMHNNKHTLGYRTPDEQNFPGPKSRGEEDSERLQLQVHQYSDATVSMSDRQITGGTAPEGNVLFMEKLVQLNEIGEVVTKRQKLSPEEEGPWKRETNEVSDSSEEELICLEELEETPSDPQGVEEMNCDPMEVPPIISHHFSILHELDLSYTQIKSLPQSISRLVALQKLFLRDCELLMELPPEIEELTNLEVLDLEGTEILCLPKEIAKLVNLTCLKVSFYGYANQANQTVIPRRVLSNLSHLNELIIDVTPYGDCWHVEVETIIDDLCSLKELRTLKLSFPTAKLLENLTIFRRLANFRFTVGRHGEQFVSRLPHDVEEEFNNREKLEKGLKYVNGSRIPNEVTKVFRRANAFFLQRHWTAKSLSEFGHENMNEVKYCLVMECNEFRTVIDSEQFYQGKDNMSESKDFQDFDEPIVLGSLEKLIIRYMKNMESIWKGPVGKGSLSNLKSLALHTCPNMITLFTIDVLSNLITLEELIVEDCPKINSLVGLKVEHFPPELEEDFPS
ncbi:hypothetical protein RHSIM_Rhsim11G0119200 [Rhododendron simsii]|uniref:Uncharacterized protein n=1 Tax=Rhododendron simsii TaxID=118357 RepID=A0A834G624_RHOSS|nr:hypothetical protein RHSIM_Rhsim11G0119200 [Rhododendron simsii]